jgi:hypothetical protein
VRSDQVTRIDRHELVDLDSSGRVERDVGR